MSDVKEKFKNTVQAAIKQMLQKAAELGDGVVIPENILPSSIEPFTISAMIAYGVEYLEAHPGYGLQLEDLMRATMHEMMNGQREFGEIEPLPHHAPAIMEALTSKEVMPTLRPDRNTLEGYLQAQRANLAQQEADA
jgi:hypothetical protein